MTIDDAIARATRAHEGQTDKAGQPYIGHLLRVMSDVRIESALKATAKMVAVLHDILEDTTVIAADLRSLGCPSEVIEAVEALTKREGEGLEAYLSRVAANRVACAVKQADLRDNSDESRLHQLPYEDAERLRRKYSTAKGLLHVLRAKAVYPSGFYRYYVRDREPLALLRQWRWPKDSEVAGGVSWPERLSDATGGRWNPGSSSDLDAVIGLGPDPYPCSEWADAISEPEARALAAKAALDIDAPRVGSDLKSPMRFEIIRTMYEFGFATFYLGRDRKTNQQVTIKALPSVADLASLTYEYEVLSRLSHPNVVRVVEKFSLGDGLCFAMEFFDGVSLSKALAREPKRQLGAGTRRLFGQLQDALDYIHDRGVVHGNLSPRSILVSTEGALKVSNFSHARWLDGRDAHLGPRGFSGTPLFSSPEHSHTGGLGPEADCFVVGILLASHLAGAHPFGGGDPIDVFRRIHDGVFDDRFRLESLEEAEREIVGSLLSIDPRQRWTGWELLRRQLRLERGI